MSQLQVTGSMTAIDATFSSNVAIGSNSISNGTTFGGGSQINRLKVQAAGYTCLEINGSSSGGSIQFTYGTNLPNQVGGLMGYNYASGVANEFAISNLLNGAMVFGTNNLERIRILSGGDVQIGGSVSGGGKLQVNGNVNINGVFQINGVTIGGGGGSGVTGSGTTNYVTKWTGASTLGNSALYDNGTNIGIGTSTPNSYLHINGTSSVKIEMSGGTSQNGILFNAIGSSPQYYIGAGNDLLLAGDRGILLGYNVANTTAALFYNSVSDSIIFGAAPASEKARITSTGTLLIGTTSDNGAKLQVNGSATFASRINATGGSNNGILVTAFTGAITLPTTGLSLNTAYDVGYIANYNSTGSLGDLYYNANSHTFNARVTSTGGRFNIQGSNQNTVLFNQSAGGTSTGFLVGRSLSSTDGQDFFIYDVAATTTRLLITSNGSLLVGSTSDLGAGYKLQVNGSISMAYASFFNFKGSSGAGDVLIDNSGSSLRVTGPVQLSNSVTFNSTALVQGLLTNYNVYNTQTSNYTLVLSDASKIIEMNVGSANTVTIPTNASVAFPIGTEITVLQYGAGVTSIAVSGGVTIVSKDSAYTIANRYTGVTLIKRATNEWYIIGNIVV